ncbi:phosphonate C-P lyase system protein PhnH [Rhodovibrio sodomensis]|uniref:Phosphonate C-P lyase system protein PhnH n=1 Tax=Rhodovibrio sodomensis TaxID=1088 RepID=A0ABS1DA91_9PROT|nr:phosphonate C-P lyase system protein PhnH [Rhodovibrio sodomensis]MBK1667275.1 phosphonate C-P lyase system protein PhnH [Rhodovibrio sodomensis]
MTSASQAAAGGRLKPGFAEPVHGAQQAFRRILQAMARPGTLQDCGRDLDPPPGLSPAMAAVCLTLADADAPLWLAPALGSEAVQGYLKFHCNAPIRDDAREAAFVLADAAGMPALDACAQGCDRYPDRSATLVVEVPSLAADGRGAWRLQGPGIASTASLAVGGLPGDFPARWRDNAALFPCGVDLILTQGHTLAALPRTTRISDPVEG